MVAVGRVAAIAAIAMSTRTGSVAGMTFSSASAVPERMMLSSSMMSDDLSKASLIPLDIDAKSESVDEQPALVSSDVLKKHSGKYGSICFVVRRPG